MADDLFYLQDTRSYVGNAMIWWRHKNSGYTPDIRCAKVWTRAAAFAQAALRDTDRPWPKAYVDARVMPIADHQTLSHSEAFPSEQVDA